MPDLYPATRLGVAQGMNQIMPDLYSATRLAVA
jgi:hypothetical protein